MRTLPVERLSAVALAALSVGQLAITQPATAAGIGDVLPVQMYCIPGVTAARCRGVFWETGALYKKEAGAAMSDSEYAAAIEYLGSLRTSLRGLATAADAGSAEDQIGERVAQVRAAVRQVGGRTCRALAGDERIDSTSRLNAAIAKLDDFDVVSLEQGRGGALVAPGFSPLRIALDAAVKTYDAFVVGLPPEPSEDP